MTVIQDNVKEKNINKNLVCKFDIIIGIDCLIMKDKNDFLTKKKFRFIILYNEIKDMEKNEIDFFLYIKDKDKREEVVKSIIRKGLFNFFKEINYFYNDEFKLFDAGYIVRSCTLNKAQKYLQKVKIKQNLLSSPPKNEVNFGLSNISMITRTKNSNLYPLLNSVLLGLFQIKPLILGLNNNEDMDFLTFETKIINKIGPKLNEIKSPSSLLNEILEYLETFFEKIDNNHNNELSIFEERERKEKFLANHFNGNIIQKYILIPKEEIINCKQCGMNSFVFKYERFIYINEIRNNGLSQVIFEANKENTKKECNFCNGKETKCIVENEIIEYPQVLLVIIGKNFINNFSLVNNIILNNNNGSISYSLNHFIESETNSLYFIHKAQILFCQKFENNQFFNMETVQNKKPIVLFYYLSRNYNNINIGFNNINNQQGQNMNILNNKNFMNNNNFGLLNPNNQGINLNIPFNQMNEMRNQIQDNKNNIMMNMGRVISNQNNQMMIPNINIMNQNMNNPNQNIINIQNQYMNMPNFNLGFQNNNAVNLNNNTKFINNNQSTIFINNNNINNNQSTIFINNNDMNNNININNINNMNNINNFQNNYASQLVKRKDIIAILIITTDQSVQCALSCGINDTFARVEEKFYEKYPELRKQNNYFISKGKIIDKTKTLVENEIEESLPIILNIVD